MPNAAAILVLARLSGMRCGSARNAAGTFASSGTKRRMNDSAGVLVQHLFGGRVNADRVDPGDPALHLELRIMDARLIVEEQPCEVDRRGLPVQPQVIGRERRQHRPHAEVDPATAMQGAHASIHERVAGSPVAPRGEPLWDRSRSHAGRRMRGRSCGRSSAGSSSSFWMKWQCQRSRDWNEASERRQRRSNGTPTASSSSISCWRALTDLKCLADRQAPKREVGREPAARVPGGAWRGHRAAIINAARLQE